MTSVLYCSQLLVHGRHGACFAACHLAKLLRAELSVRWSSFLLTNSHIALSLVICHPPALPGGPHSPSLRCPLLWQLLFFGFFRLFGFTVGCCSRSCMRVLLMGPHAQDWACMRAAVLSRCALASPAVVSVASVSFGLRILLMLRHYR